MVYRKGGPKDSGRKGQYVGHHWYDDIVVIDDAERVMPDTIPHEYVAAHPLLCSCEACERYREVDPGLLRRLRRRARAGTPAAVPAEKAKTSS